jgi:hypothetical protein
VSGFEFKVPGSKLGAARRGGVCSRGDAGKWLEVVLLLLHCNLREKPGQENGCRGRIFGNIFGDSEKVLGVCWHIQGVLVGGYADGRSEACGNQH